MATTPIWLPQSNHSNLVTPKQPFQFGYPKATIPIWLPQSNHSNLVTPKQPLQFGYPKATIRIWLPQSTVISCHIRLSRPPIPVKANFQMFHKQSLKFIQIDKTLMNE